MFSDIDYNIFSPIIAIGSDFDREKELLHKQILPDLVNDFQNSKCFSLNLIDTVIRLPKDSSINAEEFNDNMLINLDFIQFNGPVCMCLLGETLDDIPLRSLLAPDYSSTVYLSHSSVKLLQDSTAVAGHAGHTFLLDSLNPDRATSRSQRSLSPRQHTPRSVTEILSLYIGLMARCRHPLFYFRVSGTPLTGGADFFNTYLDETDPGMDRLRKKLIRSGVPIRFYGSEEEFIKLVKEDFIKLFSQFPNKSPDIDSFYIDQQCFYKEKQKNFQFNENIQRIFEELDDFFRPLETNVIKKIDRTEKLNELLTNFYRKQFSEKLSEALSTVRRNISAVAQESKADSKILLLRGARGSGKSAILSNWLDHIKDRPSNIRIIKAVMFCQASDEARDLRTVLKRIVNHIRENCNYFEEQDYCDMFPLETEVMSLGQQLEGAMMLAQHVGCALLIVVDGLDILGDKCASSTSEIKDTSWLPDNVPDNVRLVLSCPATDSALASVQRRGLDLRVVEVAPAEVLSSESGLIGLAHHLTRYNQAPESSYISLFADWQLLHNPLVQRIIAHSHHCLSASSVWNSFLEKVSECQSVMELLRRLLSIWIQLRNWEIVSADDQSMRQKTPSRKEKQTSQDRILVQGWIPDCLSLVALCRDGISIEDLLECLISLGYVGEFAVRTADIWSLFHLGRDFLLHFHNGKLLMQAGICREVVEHTFLAIASCSSMEARSSENPNYSLVDRRSKLHSLLAYRFWTHRNHFPAALEQCISHLDRASDYNAVHKLLFDTRALLSMFGVSRDSLTTFNGHMINTHKFQYYWRSLLSQKMDTLTPLTALASQFMLLDMDHTEDRNHLIGTNQLLSESSSQRLRDLSQSEFSKRLKTKMNSEIETPVDSSTGLLFFLAQVATVVNCKELAKKILNHIITNMNISSVLLAHVMWCYAKLIKSRVLRDPTRQIINQLTATTQEPTEFNQGGMNYMRCVSLTYQMILEPNKNNSDSMRELVNLVDSLQSAVLTSLVYELKSDFLPSIYVNTGENVHIKAKYLGESIVTLMMWTGPVHARIADLCFKLANTIKIGKFQMRMKAEALCRRSLWIWSQVKSVSEKNIYHEQENRCKEELVKMLFNIVSQASLMEANKYLSSTLDSRIIHLGSTHFLTRKMVPLMRLANITFQKTSVSKRRSINHSDKNVSNAIGALSTDHIIRSSRSSNCREIAPDLSFINQYVPHQTKNHREDDEEAEIDWNSKTGYSSESLYFYSEGGTSTRSESTRPATTATLTYKTTRTTGSRGLSASVSRSPNASAVADRLPTYRRQHLLNSPDSELRHIFLSSDSSLSHLVPSPSRLSVTPTPGIRRTVSAASRTSKQVRFMDFEKMKSGLGLVGRTQSDLEKKITELRQVPPVPKPEIGRRIISANFSQPYGSLVDPLK